VEELKRLLGRWRRFWPEANHGLMVVDVAARARAAMVAWGLEDVRPLGGGEIALVCGATWEGKPVVLKVQPRGHAEEGSLAAEAVALAVWSGSGEAVSLLSSRDAGLTLLLARLDPGRPLDASEVDAEARLRILGSLAARLHAASPPGRVPVAALADYCAPWRDGLADDPTTLAELDALLADVENEVLLHGDLHGGNALDHGGGWVAIDPHAVWGDRHAEIWALIDPLSPFLDADRGEALDAIRVYATAARLDPHRAHRWARTRAAAEAALIARAHAPSVEERAWGARLRSFADALA
jgi:streptomycin 6-kinase